MSIKAIQWALNQPASISEKAVLFVLANYSNEYGISWAGQKKLADQAGCTVRALHNILARMEARGVIRRLSRWRNNGSRRSDLVILEAFADRRQISPALLEALVSMEATVNGQPVEYSGSGAKQNLVPDQPEARSRRSRNEVQDLPEPSSALDTSLIPNMTRQAIQGARESAEPGDEFEASALAEAAREFARRSSAANADTWPPVDPLAPKPSKDDPLPAISNWRGWKLIRSIRDQDGARIAANPEDRTALTQAARALEGALGPAPADNAARMIWALFCCYAPRRQGRAAELAVARQWLADLAEYPDDIIDAACTEWRRGQKPFAPRPGEWLALARPILDARRAWAKRARNLAEPKREGACR